MPQDSTNPAAHQVTPAATPEVEDKLGRFPERIGPNQRLVRNDLPKEVRDRPCGRCPWRRDTDLTDFTDEDMSMLHRANGRPGAEAPVRAPMVGCHRDQPGTRHEYRLCAGWLAVAGQHHLGVRVAAHVYGTIPLRALAPQTDWPELYVDLDALTAARDRQNTLLRMTACRPRE